MTFDEAILKSIKDFMSGKIPEKLNEATEGGLKYTPEYLDTFAKDLEERDLSKIEEDEVIDGTS